MDAPEAFEKWWQALPLRNGEITADHIRQAWDAGVMFRAAAKWLPIETAPSDTTVLLFCPTRHFTNVQRVEVGVAHASNGSHHAWATHWMPLPDGPPHEEIDAILAREAEREYHERVAEEEYHREMDATHR